MWRIFYSLKAALRFRDYDPLPVTFLSTHKWMGQLERRDRRIVGKLLDNVVYFSEGETKSILISLNERLLQRLADEGVPAKKIVYVSFDDTASSSHMMLGMLRDKGALQQRGCNLCDGRDVRGLQGITDRLEEGVIVYVDDFIGSGRQFKLARDFIMQYVFTNFAEFMLVPSICEEGRAELEARGIEVVAHSIHRKSDRALQPSCTFFSPQDRNRIIKICEGIDSKMALGIEDMATMVVFYRNAPNQIPAVLRGNKNLKPFRGLFPRTTDLPFTKVTRKGRVG
jgi:hypothetical protein